MSASRAESWLSNSAGSSPGRDGIAGEESVFKGGLGDAGFPFLGARSGGFFCVVAISFYLCICRHDDYSFRGSRGSNSRVRRGGGVRGGRGGVSVLE